MKKRILFFGQAWAGPISKSVSAVTPHHIESSVIVEFSSISPFLKKLIGADVIVRTGFRPGSRSIKGIAIDTITFLYMLLKPRTKLFFLWIGTDVKDAVTDYNLNRHTIFFRLFKKYKSLAGSDVLARELNDIGISSKITYIPSPLPAELTVEELTKSFVEMRILTYIPDFRHEFYGSQMILEAAKVHRNVKFIVMGGDGKWLIEKLDNIQFIGWIKDTRKHYVNVTHVARLVEHDSYGGTVVEGLSLGRRVFYSRDVDHVIYSEFGNISMFIKNIDEELVKLESGNYTINLDGANHIRLTKQEDILSSKIIEELLK